MPLAIGRYDKYIALANASAPSSSIADGDGGYTETFTALTPANVWARITPLAAATNAMERAFANTVEANATHLVRIRYHDGVTTRTRITYFARVFYVRGVRNMNEDDVELWLACEERVS